MGASLVAGVALMVVHRFLARPYMQAVRGRKCLWCNGRPRPSAEPLTLLAGGGGGELVAIVCPRHRAPAAGFVAFSTAPGCFAAGHLRALLLLLAGLAAAAFGERRWLDMAVALFQLTVGITVNVAAFGYLAAAGGHRIGAAEAAAPTAPARLPFPAHNFFLLGIRNLLWVFRLVGIWWIVRGALSLAGA